MVGILINPASASPPPSTRTTATTATPKATAKTTTTAGTFHPLPQTRVFDSRTAGGPIPGLGTVTAQVSGHGGVPATGVSAVAVNVTAFYAAAAGYLSVYPAGVARPSTSTLNFPRSNFVANQMLARLDTSGALRIYDGSSGPVEVTLDVTGYYNGGTVSTPGGFVALTPARAVDTRHAIGVATTTPIAAGTTLTVDLAGRAGLPAGPVSAVALSVAALSPTATGNLPVYRAGTTPTVSELTFYPAVPVAGFVAVPVGAGDAVSFTNQSSGTVHLAVDVLGYFVAGTPTATGAYHPLNATRVLDTRPAGIPADATVPVTVTSAAGLSPDGVQAAMLHVTEVGSTAPGSLTLYPNGGARPAALLAYVSGVAVRNTAITTLDRSGRASLYAHTTRTVQALVDLEGYYIVHAASWHAGPVLAQSSGFAQDLSCPTATFCLAGDVRGNAYVYDGTTWTAENVVEGQALEHVSCWAAGACLAATVVDTGAAAAPSLYRLDGTAWTTLPAAGLSGLAAITGLSCVSAAFCLVTADAGDRVWNGTALHTVSATGANTRVTGLSCASSTFCMATVHDGDGHEFISRWNGSTWAHSFSDDRPGHLAFIRAISCVSTAFCLAGDDASVVRWNGTTWGSPTTPSVFPPTALSCVSATFCMGAFETDGAFTFNGSRWTAAPNADRPDQPVISCGAVRSCWSIDRSVGRAAHFDGANWAAAATVVPVRAGLGAVSCTSPVFCVSVDDGVETNATGLPDNGHRFWRFDGTSWDRTPSVPGDSNVAPDPLSCAGTFCVALTPAGPYAYDGSAWRAMGTTTRFGVLSCTSATFCLAQTVGSSPNQVWSWDGTSWTVASAQPAGGIWALSCVSASFCVAAVNNGHPGFDGFQTYRGPAQGWSTVTFVDGIYPRAVSCPSTSFCLATGTNVIDPPDPGRSASRLRAQAGDGSTYLSTQFDGRTWSKTVENPHPFVFSCVSSTFCLRIDDSGSTSTYDGTSWTTRSSLDPDQSYPSVSCTSPTFCGAVSGQGQVFTWS